MHPARVDYATRAARALLGATAHPGGTTLSRHLLRVAGVGPHDVVLDVACGDGATLRLLGPRAFGVDLEPRAVAQAGPRAVVADAHALPLAGGSIDVVLLECALSTFAAPGGALAEAVRVLRPGGRLAMTDVLLDREGADADADADVLAVVDRITTARTLSGYAGLLAGVGLRVTVTEDRAADALALVQRVRRRLPLPAWRRTARTCEQAVLSGALGYGLLVAVRDRSGCGAGSLS